MEFDDPGLPEALAACDAAALDALPFGVIAFDADDRVVAYNAHESAHAGIAPERVLGRDLFTEVAPCTDNRLVAQRFRDQASDGATLDEQLDFVFTLRMDPTPVRLRLVGSTQDPRRYLVVRYR